MTDNQCEDVPIPSSPAQDLPSEWRLFHLGEVVSLRNGTAFNANDWKTSGIPIVRIQNLKDTNAPFNYFQGDPNSKVPVYDGDLLFSWSGSKGTSFGPHIWNGSLGVLNQHIFKVTIRTNASVLQDYLYYALKNLTTKIEESAYGLGALVHVRKGDLEATLIPFPPIPEQQVIAKVLRVVQQAKEATEKTVTATQLLKQSFMRHLFTYGPVPYNKADQVLVQDTEIGPMPQHWKVDTLGNNARLSSGGTPSRDHPEYWGGSIPWVKTGEINYRVIRSTEESISQAGLENSSARLFPSGTMLIAMYGQGVTRGRVGILGIEAATNQACAAVFPTDELDTGFLFHTFVYHYERIRDMGHGANQRNLSMAMLKTVKIPIPPLDEQRAINDTLTVIGNKIEAEEKRREVLDILFQTLLQRLMTGKIRVGGVSALI